MTTFPTIVRAASMQQQPVINEKNAESLASVTFIEVLQVKKSLARLAPIAGTFTDIFFSKLFEFAPELKQCFGSLTLEQSKQVFYSAAYIVQNLNNPGLLFSLLNEMSSRLEQCGFRSVHFEAAGKALLYALTRTLGSYNSVELRSAWISVFSFISRELRRGFSPSV